MSSLGRQGGGEARSTGEAGKRRRRVGAASVAGSEARGGVREGLRFPGSLVGAGTSRFPQNHGLRKSARLRPSSRRQALAVTAASERNRRSDPRIRRFRPTGACPAGVPV